MLAQLLMLLRRYLTFHRLWRLLDFGLYINRWYMLRSKGQTFLAIFSRRTSFIFIWKPLPVGIYHTLLFFIWIFNYGFLGSRFLCAPSIFFVTAWPKCSLRSTWLVWSCLRHSFLFSTILCQLVRALEKSTLWLINVWLGHYTTYILNSRCAFSFLSILLFPEIRKERNKLSEGHVESRFPKNKNRDKILWKQSDSFQGPEHLNIP